MKRHTVELKTSDITGLFHGKVLHLNIPDGMITLTVLHVDDNVLFVFQGGPTQLTVDSILAQTRGQT